MSKILVVDDEPFITDMVEATLLDEGYEVLKAYSGEEALEVVEQYSPDLLVLDLMLPGMDGYEVSRQLQNDARFNHIPIIMLTARTSISDRVAGYERGADDYITKPFDPDELLIRVRAQLNHLQHEERSELTGLPGSQAVEAAIMERTANSEDGWTIIYADIDRFTAYNEVYSFLEGDNIIREAGKALSQAVKELGTPIDFVGHIGGDDFVVLTVPEKTAKICNRATELFNAATPKFFDATDYANGYFTFVNHTGETVHLPLVALSFDVVDNSPDEE
jgi:diguanylate cyclase (GGDEF)-like protein